MLRRRQFLQAGAVTAGTLLWSDSFGRYLPRAHASGASDERFLFVVTATGGANMLDGFWPVLDSEVTGDASTLTVCSQSQVVSPGDSSLRCIKQQKYEGSPFSSSYATEELLRKHYRDMTVVTVENTSVNHLVAQKRSVTGAGINAGRTIMEAMALRHGKDKLIANCNMSTGGYIEPGADASIDDFARGEIVNSPTLFALSTDGSRGVAGAPARELIDHARALRERLEDQSAFGKRNARSSLRKRMLQLRRELQPRIGAADLISKLMLIPDAASSELSGAMPLSDYDLESTPDGQRIWDAFPDLMVDPVQAQAALAFLLVRYSVSSAVTLGPSSTPVFLKDRRILGTPIGFDYSHVSHSQAQNIMWSRTAMLLDGLIGLLKTEPYGDATLWDRSIVYVATDFGRSRDRPKDSDSFSSAHELNNANLFISPLFKGNRVYGGVDKKTLKFYGFDRKTGEPAPGRVMREGDLYSLVAHAADISFTGRTDMTAVLR